MFLLIDNYDSFTYNLKALLDISGVQTDVIRNDMFVPADKYWGIVISPGPSNPGNAGTSNRYLREYGGKKPVFGVCLGMQCIGHFLGCEVGSAPVIRHGKTEQIQVTGRSMLFRGLPEKFTAVRYHSLAVMNAGDRVTSIATTDGTAMSIEDRERMLFGVQFHPESILSEYGREIIGNFIQFSRKVM